MTMMIMGTPPLPPPADLVPLFAGFQHTLVACSAHLVARVGRNPDEKRLKAFENLSSALNDCCVMQTGCYVAVAPPPPLANATAAPNVLADSERRVGGGSARQRGNGEFLGRMSTRKV